MKEFLTLQEVAEWLGVSDKTVSRLVLSGQLAGTKVGGMYRLRSADVQEYLEKQQTLLQSRARADSLTSQPSTEKNPGALSPGASCARCGRLLKGTPAVGGECQAPSCGLPLCRLCASNEYDRCCRQHRRSLLQKLDLARQKLSRSEIPLLVTAEEARQRELVFIQRFDQKIRQKPYLTSPLDGARVEVLSWDSLHTEDKELDQARLAELQQPDLDPGMLPQNLSSIYTWVPPKRGSRAGASRFVVCASVLADLTEMAANGFSASANSRSRLLKLLEDKVSSARDVEAFHVLGLASPTGWATEARELIEGSRNTNAFSSLYLGVCLIDLNGNTMSYNALDQRLRPYVRLFRGEMDEELVSRLSAWVRDELYSGKTSLTVPEAAAGAGMDPELVRETFVTLEAGGGFVLDTLPDFGLTISRRE